ncbi:tRNA (adenosine(37)-N6)-threonylcarbamoyltransferase complex ATPase subunit type 1 TsaE [Candidatus Falkowbacteria bacterium]|jgi:tRNA threonylcarbamoyladenosine biosynthesis protein TsaE|nr:tRNA (adenosine(37)-N6)-threonylcarbamoyltransferase complex ATPase subunit type 1 TsaE [Patescibacteria group bacterium]MDD3435288.1 tRNA (adenosine(37)-N6)-threonylcarbamoyltransferase complex ATPase subunit type 1 TsaE [Patescibacteria group bacterium]MDD4466228.1 tRNA (adenosine(37)-N6)-threonylcarbamoyltransferase complex ATPase subunit type 1 TsaE [Patescibacteria group bacterium]NCU42973.1 tRNA (adenosine(37)-N6)-threonylcarbamoyltransferase complex ATPase subunit type 1 TsaE [Candidat
MEKVLTKTPEETEALGRRLGKNCHGGEVFLLVGELGAGKTYLTKGLARGLGIKSVITSPTFNIMKIYEGRRLNLCHVDAYRLQSSKDLLALGVREYLDSPTTVTVIEWADLVEDLNPRRATKIKFKNLIDGREIKIYQKK